MFKPKKKVEPEIKEPRDMTFEEFEMHDAKSSTFDNLEDEHNSDQPDENDLRDPSYSAEYDSVQEEEEAEERKRIHQIKKKNDKIFNNSYNTGDGPEHEFGGNSSIKISQNYVDSHLHDPEKYKDYVDSKIVQEDIHRVINNSPEILAIISSEANKKKYSKPEINSIFSILKSKLNRGEDYSAFISPIQILEAVSNITMLEYKKIFDTLDYEHKEDLLNELNKTHRIFEHSSVRSKKLF